MDMGRVRQWGAHRHRRWPWLVSLWFVLGVVHSLGTMTVAGHGFMTDPKPRAADHLKGDITGCSPAQNVQGHCQLIGADAITRHSGGRTVPCSALTRPWPGP